MSVAPAHIETVVEALTALLGKRVSTSKAVREHHGKDESWHHPAPPDAVCYAHSTEEVAEIVKICARHKTPIIPYHRASRRSRR